MNCETLFCRFRQFVVSLAVLALFGLSPVRSDAHGPSGPAPTADELAQIQPELSGSLAFARKFSDLLGSRFSDRQLQLAADLNESLNQQRAALQGTEDISAERGLFSKTRLAAYYRWQAERQLLQLVRSHPSTIEVDLDDPAQGGPPTEEITINPFHRTFLLHVRSGDGPVSFSTHTWDMQREWPTGHETVPTPPGDHYLLITAQHPPMTEALEYLAFAEQAGQQRTFVRAFRFVPEPFGQLAVDVVDAQGESIPVLLQLKSKETGELWEPAGAIDMRELFNGVVPYLSNPDLGYQFYLPGNRRGHYWVVNSPVEMPIPAGDWTVKILRGLEYTPIEQDVRVEADTWTRTRWEPKRWTDMAQQGWYSGDDHVHARLMSGEDARKLLAYTRAVDINVSNILEMGDVRRSYYQQRGFGSDYRVQHKQHWLIPGQEDPRSVLGHVIGLNLNDRVRDVDRYLDNLWVAKGIRRQGGLYGHTHVGANACFVEREMALFTPENVVDFNSIMQAGLGTELYYDFLNLGFQMTGTAGADTPYGGTIGAVRTYAYCGNADEFTPDAWFDAVRAGHTFVTNGPMIELTVDGAIPGETLQFNDDKQVQVVAHAWGDSGSSAPARLELIALGTTCNAVASQDASQTELNATAELNVGYGKWVAARVVGHDGSEALTTPVYLKRTGFRHWNRSEADSIIEQQLAVLSDIAAEVKRAENLVSRQPATIDYWSRRTAEQSAIVKNAIANAQAYYEQLRVQLEQEQAAIKDE